MKNSRVLISGASIAGPALAFWLHRYGFEVTVLEKAREVRTGGQAVDFKGPTHRAVLQKMGILEAVQRASVPENDGIASGLLPPAGDNIDAQQEQMTDAYRGGSWRLPELMAKIPGADDFYLDSISRVTTDRYAKGRVALVGDSAYGNALGGFGTGLAIVGAYVLAGELHRADGDFIVAFAQYEAKYRDYASVSQKVNGRLLAPASRLGIRARNVLFSALSLFGPLMKLVDSPAKNIRLEDYADSAVLSA